VAVVAGVLLDHVAQDPAQAGGTPVGPGPPGQPAETIAAIQHLRDFGAGVFHGPLLQGGKLLEGILGGRVPFPVAVGRQSIASHGGAYSRPCRLRENQAYSTRAMCLKMPPRVIVEAAVVARRPAASSPEHFQAKSGRAT
jgi:hypothetical protein